MPGVESVGVCSKNPTAPRMIDWKGSLTQSVQVSSILVAEPYIGGHMLGSAQVTGPRRTVFLLGLGPDL